MLSFNTHDRPAFALRCHFGCHFLSSLGEPGGTPGPDAVMVALRHLPSAP